MWENVGALLAEADCDWKDVGYIIVYLRDMADYVTVNKLFEQQFPDIPRVIVLAPVCRPKWLIEMECMAVKQCNNQAYAAF
jgi:enamine deaminase RidA (YjgF/YER057c/UK114 family)